MSVRMGVTGTASLRRTARRLQQAGPVVRSETTKELQRVGPPVLRQVRTAVRRGEFPAAPSRGGTGPSGLREHLATSTIIRRFGSGLRFVVADPRGQTLARYTDGAPGSTRWRHPVFGNTAAWVTQKADPWFHVTIRAARPVFAAAVQRAGRRITQRLGG